MTHLKSLAISPHKYVKNSCNSMTCSKDRHGSLYRFLDNREGETVFYDDLRSAGHPTGESMTYCSESGRSMVEMLAVLGLIGLLTWGALAGLNAIMDRARAQAIAKAIKTQVFQRQANGAVGVDERLSIVGPYGDLFIGGGEGKKSDYFYVEVPNVSSGVCERLLKSSLIQPEIVAINAIDNAECVSGENTMRFYFPRNPGALPTWTDSHGMIHRCAPGASSCDSQGKTTSCTKRLYLDGEDCADCPEHAVTCTDATTPTECDPGYYVNGAVCSPCAAPMLTCTDAETATSCGEGYFLNEGSCEACPEHATTCSDGETATACEARYYLSEGSCLACPAHATACDEDGRATACEGNWHLNADHGKCYFCEVGQFKATDGKCYTCLFNGYKTADASECHACDDRFMYSNRCYNCDNTTGLSTTVSEWKRCPERFGLTGTGSTSSYYCAGTVYEDSSGNRHCDLTCPENTFGGTGKCVSCNSSTQAIALLVITPQEGIEYCSNCPNRTFMWTGHGGLSTERYCAKNCTGEGQFLDTNGNCFTCTSTSQFRLGWGIGDANRAYFQDMKNALIQKCHTCPHRFYDNNASNQYCYHCTHASAVTNTTAAECTKYCKGYRYVSATNTCARCPADYSTLTTDTTKEQCCPIPGSAEWTALSEANRTLCCERVHATGCDANGNFTCESGYILYNNKCVPTTCSTDADCYSACATCSGGVCTNTCDLTPTEGDCPANACIEYNPDTQMCEDVCERLSYLEATGTQHIDTKMKFIGSRDKVVADFQFTNVSTVQQRIFGTYTTLRVDFYINGSGYFAWALKNTDGNWQSTGVKATTNRYTFTLDGKNNIAKLEKHGDASPAYNATITTAHGNTSANNLTLFSAVTTNKAKARIYSAQVYRDGVLQRDFIPVLYKKTTPAMFDRQNKELYLNAGTGTFNYKKVNNTNW